VAKEVLDAAGVKLDYFMVGTMIEVRARAARRPDRRGGGVLQLRDQRPDQMTMALSRDDAGRFLPTTWTEEAGIFPDDPFQSLDQAGVGLLVKMAVEKAGRPSRS